MYLGFILTIDIEEQQIELPGEPTIPHTPTVEEYLKHKIMHYPLKALTPKSTPFKQ